MNVHWICRAVMLLVTIIPCFSVNGQNTYVPMGSEEYRILDREIILSGYQGEMHTGIKPFRRSDVAQIALHQLALSNPGLRRESLIRIIQNNNEFAPLYADSLGKQVDQNVYIDSTRTFYFRADAEEDYELQLKSERPFLKAFYKTPAHFYELNDESFYLRVNPLIHFLYGKESADEDPLFINKRGIEIRGGIDKRVFFATDIIETQLRPPSHVRKWVSEHNAFPNAGLFKKYTSSLFDFDGAYDYLSSSGYLGFNISKHVGVHLGHGKNFIGDGYRSLLLSDFAKNYFYLKLNTRVWKFHYQNIFAELSAAERESNISVFPKKYMAAHYLSFKAKHNLTFGIYEAVIFAREDGRFELQYLNPVILYRTIEQHVGSPDNVLIGMNVRWDVWKRYSFYAQIMLDEFKVGEFFSSDKWWGNKYGIQLGVKYVDAFDIENMDLQLEYNQVRPFTYSHRDSLGSYAHFNQALAHPLGANFTEAMFALHYKPVDRLDISLRAFIIRTAEDTDSVYYGSSILRPNDTRNAEYGIEQGQGVAVDNSIINVEARYRLKHNFFLEAQYFRRDYTSDNPGSSLQRQFFSLGLRWNLFYKLPEF